jgi:hypothetical protein
MSSLRKGHRVIRRHTQVYTGIHKGYIGIHRYTHARDTQAYTSIHRYTQGVHRYTQAYVGIHKGYTGICRYTQGVHRYTGTQVYAGAALVYYITRKGLEQRVYQTRSTVENRANR